MIHRTLGATLRAFLVASLVAMPAMVLPGISSDVTQMAALLALAGGILTLVEYMSTCPSLTEFRSAPPYNRLRFGALAIMVIVSTLIVRNVAYPSAAGEALASVGGVLGGALDFPFSPVSLILRDMPPDIRPRTMDVAKACAGSAFVVSIIVVVIFVAVVRVLNWPARRQAFNVWVNLPRFDPTAGGDVLLRLKRDAVINVSLGMVLSFLMPAAIRLATSLWGAVSLDGPLTLVWGIAAWAFLPASLMMRGVALMKIADLIEAERRRVYSQSGPLQPA
ncbi:membrane protein [Roseivivax halodurans JCM 10272]|uniref:Membrane protein n=1 Tax=Roseivivax halodurans JCM 10272 TaxID=1449350 RepID=X7EAL6_9RHOB|nr:hypothetical protein [Roseivivax halodurans]ETX13134.1 membrane protein [Roseivivax halodurans JCM 10272]